MRIPTLIVGGFLGSGKTTFIIKSLLPRFKGKNLAIIVNDFGQINYDKIRLYQEGMKVYGVEGGCFCCELGGQFLNTLAKLKVNNPEILIVETSGVSDPSPIYYGLEASGFCVELVLGVFGLDMREDLLNTPLVQAQVEGSHCLVLTKADLLTEWDLEKKLSIFSIYQKPMFIAKEGVVEENIEDLFGSFKKKPEFGRGHKSFQTWTMKMKGFYSKLELEEFFLKLPKSIYRVKGVVQCFESPVPLGLNFSFGYLTWERLETEEEPFLVFVGENTEKRMFECFPKGGLLSLEHEKLCFPIGEFDAREGIAYFNGQAMDELDLAEKLWEELEDDDFLLVSGEELSFRSFKEIKKLLRKCESSEFKKIVFWKVPSGVVSYILENLPKDKVVYHLSKHYLLPKAHMSLRVDIPDKEKVLLPLIEPKQENAIIYP